MNIYTWLSRKLVKMENLKLTLTGFQKRRINQLLFLIFGKYKMKLFFFNCRNKRNMKIIFGSIK